MNNIIVGLTGKKRSGKDTAAKALPSFHRESFAAPIRRAVCDILCISPEILENEKESAIAWLDGVTVRHLMQTLGTEWGRDKIHNELWIRSMSRRILFQRQVVITDVRFDNEAEFIKNKGGIVISIERSSRSSEDSHASEKGVSHSLINEFVYNDTSIDYLHNCIRKIVLSYWSGAML